MKSDIEKMQELVREVAVVMSATIFDAVFMWTRSSLSHLTRIYKTIDNYLKISYNLLIITNYG